MAVENAIIKLVCQSYDTRSTHALKGTSNEQYSYAIMKRLDQTTAHE